MNIAFFIFMMIIWIMALSISNLHGKIRKLENILKQIVLDRQRGQMGFTKEELEESGGRCGEDTHAVSRNRGNSNTLEEIRDGGKYTA